jgi:hypothetical protein
VAKHQVELWEERGMEIILLKKKKTKFDTGFSGK